jgi:hypothetical protein
VAAIRQSSLTTVGFCPTTNPIIPERKHTMTTRITKKHLQHQIDNLNAMFGYSLQAYSKDADGKFTANTGTYVLDCAYGGYRLSQICNENGGERDITPRGTARETYDNIRAFIAGADAARKAAA